MIPLKEDKHYIENEDDTKEFLQERRSLASFTYNPNSRYSESFVWEKINIMIDFFKKLNKFNTFRIVNEKQFREIMLDEGEWILGKKYPEPFFKFKLNVGQVEGIYGNITMYIFSWNQYQY
mgnify:CR=1 FL=1